MTSVPRFVGFLAGFGLLAACSVDLTGLGADIGGSGNAGGTFVLPGSGGTDDAGSNDTVGSGGNAGIGDNDGSAGVDGSGGMAKIVGADASDGTGSGGVAGSGGQGGTGGSPCASCRSCFRCVMDVCQPDPNAAWNVICSSATIASLKPSGAVWDSTSNAPPGTWPDTFCRLTLDNNRVRSTSTVMDSLMPVWNASVTPTGSRITAALLMSANNRMRIAVTDVDATDEDAVCTTTPRVTAADLEKGTVTFANLGSCTSLTLGLVCEPAQ